MCDYFNGSYIEFGSTSSSRINPFEVSRGIAKEEIIKSKNDFALSICEQAKRAQLTSSDVTDISKALSATYANYVVGATDVVPTLTDFTRCLKEIDGGGKESLSYALENYCEGGQMDMFGYQSNVDLNNRFVCFGMTSLGGYMRPLAMTIMLEFINVRVYENWVKGITTWIYVDEAHEMLNDPNTCSYFTQLFREIRKLNGMMTGITTNISDVMKNKQSKTMLSNSEFLVMMKQSNNDMEELSELLDISKEQLSYVTDSKAGSGLMKHGNVFIPFDAEIPKDSKFFPLYDTDPHEKDGGW